MKKSNIVFSLLVVSIVFVIYCFIPATPAEAGDKSFSGFIPANEIQHQDWISSGNYVVDMNWVKVVSNSGDTLKAYFDPMVDTWDKLGYTGYYLVAYKDCYLGKTVTVEGIFKNGEAWITYANTTE